MGQGPADDLIKSVKGIFNGDNIKQSISDAINRKKEPEKKEDTSGHDAAVKRANEAFRKQAEEKAAAAKKPEPKPQPKKTYRKSSGK